MYIMENLWAKPTFLAAKVSIILFLLHCSLHIKAFAHHLLGRRSAILILRQAKHLRHDKHSMLEDVNQAIEQSDLHAFALIFLMQNYTEAIISWTTPLRMQACK